jgi:membrane protease YdiL (CAAX protease family)
VRFSLRLLGLIGGAMALAAMVVGLLKPVADLLFADGGAAYDLGPAFRRVAEAIAFFGGIWLWRRYREAPPRVEAVPGPGRATWFFFGFLVGTASLTLLLLFEVRSGALQVVPAPAEVWVGKIAESLATCLLLALFEETIFRGFVLGGLAREVPLGAAFFVSSLLYGACHFFHTPVLVEPGSDLTVGWRALGAHLDAVTDPSHLASLVGLTVVGATFAAARLLGGGLACAIGLHAGWIFLFKTAKLVVWRPPGVRWLYGPEGVVGRPEVLFALLVVVVVLALPRLRASLGTFLETRRS